MAPKVIALITGANQGIGFETARRLATEHKNYHVIMAGRRKEAVEEAAKTLLAEGLDVEPLVIDLNSDASIEAAVADVEKKHGYLDVLVNNAAISSYTLTDASASALTKTRVEAAAVFDTNITSTMVVTDAFLPLMKKAPAPRRIVFVSSTLSSLQLKADPKAPTHANVARAYSISKAALNMLMLHYLVQLEDDAKNWKVNGTCPGYCATSLNGYSGYETPAFGSINSVRLATLGPDGESGTFSNKAGPLPW